MSTWNHPQSSRVLRGLAFVLLVAVVASGCGPRPVVGGTPGVLRSGQQMLAEVQVTLHRQEGSSWQYVGFADTTTDGTFELVTRGAAGPLVLPPGDYRATLESVGAPIQIPPVYTKPDSSPLAIRWSGSEGKLEIELTKTTIQ
jgi:hypothetical protein